MVVNCMFKTKLFSLLAVFMMVSSVMSQNINSCDENLGNGNKFYKIDLSNDVKSIVFNYKKCNLNLSDFTYLSYYVNNASEKDIIVDVQYFGPQQRHVNQGRFFVAKQSKKQHNLILCRQKLPKTSSWEPYFPEVRGLPGHYVRHWNAFNLEEVKSVEISISSNDIFNSNDIIEVSNPFGYKSFEFASKDFKEQTLPLLDDMGQYASESWENKLSNLGALKTLGKKDIKKYANAKFNKGLSKYGGFKSAERQEAKGFFYTKKINGKWWFVDPNGYLFWSQGVTGTAKGSATSTKNRRALFSTFAKDKATTDWLNLKTSIDNNSINFYELNIKRKYGTDWEDMQDQVSSGRMKSWGLNTYGAWSSIPRVNKHPFTLIIHPNKQGIGNIKKMIDPFSDAFHQDLKRRLSWLESYKNDPWLLGVFVNNELHFRSEMDIPNEILGLNNDVPARKAFENMLRNKYGIIKSLNEAWGSNFDAFKNIRGNNEKQYTEQFNSDMMAYLQYFAETYYKLVATELKNVLPNHLYFGSRLHGEAKYNKPVQKAASKYCDVISFNIYEYSVKGFKIHTDIDKPALIGEFHFGTGSHGVWGVGLRSAYDLENQAALYEQYIKDASTHPNFVGAHWFQWADQPATGRGSDGENFRIGLVNVTDQPYQTMVDALKSTSKQIYNNRINN